eukprot:7216870-Pyramimonas_sp.AAC.1
MQPTGTRPDRPNHGHRCDPSISQRHKQHLASRPFSPPGLWRPSSGRQKTQTSDDVFFSCATPEVPPLPPRGGLPSRILS